jgi:predicted enzyme related to lactoylglutathione lyase
VDTNQPDPEAAVDFYGGLFGWDFEDVTQPGSPGSYFVGRIRGGDVAAVGSIPDGMPPMAVWNSYVWVESADETAGKAVEAGGSVVMDAFDVGDAGRMAACTDPEGAVFFLWQPNEHRGATVVNEHGSLNFNNLNTRELDRAKEFYGAVFGWETLSVDGGFEMWSLRAYGDRLEELNPGTRERMAEVGGPPGFENVVAGINPIGDDQPDTPAHWGVTFAVDDADAIARTAEELGGAVLVPPFDAPWVRMTVLADPQGATFTASKFVPENKDLGTGD